jgi:tripeptide aminopeptidase
MENTPLATGILNRFLRYAVVDTMSDPHILDHRPTTPGQMELLELLRTELQSLHLSDILFDPKGYLIARIPSNLPLGMAAPTIGFMAHVDTADDVPGNGVLPRVVESYDGGDIQLNSELVLAAEKNPELAKYLGQTLVVTDGTTLLGSDDKAGIAILMSIASRLMEENAISHGEVEIIFTSDEETGAGMDYFPVKQLRSRCCYTIDGGVKGEIEAECFNAATVEVDFLGIPYHLGAARGKMVNSVSMAVSFIGALPRNESPEATDGRYGYYCAEEIRGTSAHTHVVFYLRDFDLQVLKRRVATLQTLAATTEMLFPGGKVTVAEKYIYYNMYEAIKKVPDVMKAIHVAGQRLGLPLQEHSIRGGTDGARLAEMGIPAPNIFTGGHNLHSLYEWAALPAMEASALLVEQIIKYWGEVPV